MTTLRSTIARVGPRPGNVIVSANACRELAAHLNEKGVAIAGGHQFVPGSAKFDGQAVTIEMTLADTSRDLMKDLTPKPSALDAMIDDMLARDLK